MQIKQNVKYWYTRYGKCLSFVQHSILSQHCNIFHLIIVVQNDNTSACELLP